MGQALTHRRRRLGTAPALLGMAFYVVLFPWHTVSQATTARAGAPAISAATLCHNVSAAPNSEPSKGAKPASKTHCPICSGFAALQLALAGAAMPMLVPPESGSALFDGTDDHLADAPGARAAKPRPSPPPHLISISIHAPRSRGKA